MSVYVIVDIAVRDQSVARDYAEYVAKVRPIIERHGGRYLARGGATTVLDGDWNPEKIVLIEFPSAEHVERWRESAEYRAIVGLRERATTSRAIVVEGCEPAAN
jgi:uncharacterized protein (DUF1330 family)